MRAKLSILTVLIMFASFLVTTVAPTAPAIAENNGAGNAPLAGWSTWRTVAYNPTESNIKAQAQAMHDSGLTSHGYQFINVDDFYYRDPETNVDQYGRWVVDSSKFPDGMANVASYVHNLGEKLGMYLTPGIPVAAYNQNTPIQGTSYHARDIVSNTTDYETNYNFGNGRMYFIDYNKNPPAAQAFLNSWADLLASYSVDYLKIDGVGDGDQADVQHWSQALQQSGRTIHFELSNQLDPASGAFWAQWSNGYRIDNDVQCYCSTQTDWSHIAVRFNDLPQWVQYDNPGAWADPDSVELGNGSSTGLTSDERRTVMSLWAIANAPIVIDADLTKLDSGDLALLTNDEVLGVDRSGDPAHPVVQNAQQQVWWAPTGNGGYNVGLINISGAAANVTVNWSDLGFTGSAAVRDLWSHTDLGSFTGSYTVSLPSHGSTILKVTAATNATAIGGPLVSRLSGRCADLIHASQYNGVQAEVWDCNGNVNQRVTYNSAAKSLAMEGKCLDAYNNQTTAGTRVDIYNCNGGANQQWTMNLNGTITGVQSGLCLDVAGTTNPNGSGLELWTCNGGGNQQWMLSAGATPPPPASGKVASGVTGKCLDDDNGNTNGTPVIIWDCNGGANQTWSFVNGTLQIAGKCADVAGAATANGAKVELYDCNGGGNQQWTSRSNGTLVGAAPGRCLDDPNSSTTNGTQLVIWDCNAGANQRWAFS